MLNAGDHFRALASKLDFKAYVRDWQFWLVVVLACQFAIIQLITHVQYWDGLRNLSWGIYLLEEPGFLTGEENRYDMIYGFQPDPPSLASVDLPRDDYPRLISWWGPLFPILVAAIFKVTNSNLIIQMIAPVCGGILVLVTYLFGVQYFNRRIGFLAAFFLSMLPLFREHAVMAYTETISGLFLFTAFWAHLKRHTILTALFGSLAVLVKIDLIFIYLGTILLTEIFEIYKDRKSFDYWHIIFTTLLPGFFALWPVIATVLFSRPSTLAGLPSYDLFIYIGKLAIQQFFPILPLITYITLFLIGVVIFYGLLIRRFSFSGIYRLLSIWLILGFVALIVYLATPGASNNPRVIIPTFPALCLLLAAGNTELSGRARMIIEGYFIIVFLLTSFATTLYQVIQSENLKRAMPVWEYLEGKPKGFVITEYFWDAVFYAHQPATWFFEDAIFERNILYDIDNFKNYIQDNPIRYLVIPVNDEKEILSKLRIVRFYNQLPLGRMLALREEPLISDPVRGYLDRSYSSLIIGDFIVYAIY